MGRKMRVILKGAMTIGLAGMLLLPSGMQAQALAAANDAKEDTSWTEHPNHNYGFEYSATEHVIDTNRRGILHIHKAVNDQSQADDIDPGIGSVQGTQNQEVRNELKDVTYTIYRVADIVQGHLNETGTQVSLEYESLIKDSTADHNIIPIPSGLSSAQQLDEWVAGLRDAEDDAKRMSNLGELPHWSGTTDAKGNVTFDGDGSGLPLGIYVVYEAAYPSQVVNPQSFVVSLPMTTSADGDHSCWIYDIQAHPKNASKELSIEKHIIADEGATTPYETEAKINDPSNDILTDAEDYEIGDTIRYWVKAEVPEMVGELEYYYILDRMSIGQTFINDVASGNQMAQMEVWGKSIDGEMVYIPRFTGLTENYRVISVDEIVNETNTKSYEDMYGSSMTIRDLNQTSAYAYENAFEVLFNTHSLSEDKNTDGTRKRVPLYNEIYITFNLTLNEKAIIGEPGNVNDIALVVSHITTDSLYEIKNEPHDPKDDFNPFEDTEKKQLDIINPQCIDTRVYTYAAHITKLGEGADSMKGAEFELRDAKGNQIRVSQYQNAQDLEKAGAAGRVGDYYIDQNAAASAVITVDEDQKVCIYGLEDGMYQLVETKTCEGYQLLKEPIVLTFGSNSNMDAYPMQYQESAQGHYFRIEEGKGYYIEQDGMKLKVDVTGHNIGDYVKVEGDVYCYTVAGDDGSMEKDASLVQNRYSYRWTDAEALCFLSNYGMTEGVCNLSVFNRHGYNIPSTGGSGAMIYVAAGSIMALFGVLICYLLGGKKKKENAE